MNIPFSKPYSRLHMQLWPCYPGGPSCVEYATVGFRTDVPTTPTWTALATTGPHTIYVTLGDPSAPMAVPWVEVLDDACVWADGETTSSGALDELATDLYTNSGLEYNGYQSHYEYRSPPARLVFNLTDFLGDWEYADCQDAAFYLSILSSSIGCSLTQTKRIHGDDGVGESGMTTKKILPIGKSTWAVSEWNFHHIAWLSNVYDACVKVDSTDARIPINEDIDNPYKTDLYDSGDWVPKNPFYLGQTDPHYGLATSID